MQAGADIIKREETIGWLEIMLIQVCMYVQLLLLLVVLVTVQEQKSTYLGVHVCVIKMC